MNSPPGGFVFLHRDGRTWAPVGGGVPRPPGRRLLRIYQAGGRNSYRTMKPLWISEPGSHPRSKPTTALTLTAKPRRHEARML